MPFFVRFTFVNPSFLQYRNSTLRLYCIFINEWRREIQSLFVGNYLYLEASSHTDRTAQLISPLQSSGHYCFSAYYHMYGTDSGTLSFKVLQHGHSHTLKSFRGDLGNHWNHVRMEISIHHHFQVSINGRNTVI